MIGIVIIMASRRAHPSLFVPDVPAPLLVIMVPIEVISFLSRP